VSKFLVAVLLLAVFPAHAKITEVSTYHDPQVQAALSSANADTWIIFDIDNTLLKSTSMMGSPQWSDYMRSQAEAAGLSKEEAERLQHAAFGRAQKGLRVELTEPAAVPLVQGLQRRGLTTFALTARAKSLVEVTLSQVSSSGFDFSKSQPRVQTPGERDLHSGVLFAGGVSKGELLRRLMNASAKPPKEVIFFDDRRENLESVEGELGRAGVPFTGYRYGFVDTDVKNFRPDLANVQWMELKRNGQSLSNSETLRLILEP
jgi:phosphoglycolate phosphatase-like HAD superfamily hydrolase